MAKSTKNTKQTPPTPPAGADKAETTTTDSTLEKIGKEVLAKNEHFSAVYVTSDGYVFASESDAKNYAKTLENQEIVTVKK